MGGEEDTGVRGEGWSIGTTTGSVADRENHQIATAAATRAPIAKYGLAHLPIRSTTPGPDHA